MLDKDKLWLVFYVNVASLQDADIPAFLQRLSLKFQYDESVQRIIIPTRKGECRVEFYNMGNVPPLELDEFKELVEAVKNQK